MTIEGAGVQWAYWADAATFLVSVAAVRAVAPIPPPPGASSPGPRAVVEGFKYLRGRKVLQGSFIIDLIAMVFGTSRALFAAPVAAIGGARYLSAFSMRRARRVLLRPHSRAGGAGGFEGKESRSTSRSCAGERRWPCSAEPNHLGGRRSFDRAGGADMVSGVFRTAILQSSTPAHLKGRMTGIELLVVASGPSLGDFVAGVVAGLTTARVSAVSGGIACMVGVGIMALLLPAFARCEAA